MRIPNLTMSDAVVNRLNVLRVKTNQLNQQLATGQRIALSSDDPSGANRVMTLRSEMAVTQQYSRNVDLTTGISEATGSALSTLGDISSRAGELVALSSSGTNSAEQRASYAVEINQLILEAKDAGNAQFNGQYLFNGTNTANAPYSPVATAPDTTDHPTSVTGPTGFLADGTTPDDGGTINLTDSLSVSPYNKGSDNVKIATFINRLISLRTAMETNDTAGISAAGTGLATSEADVINAVAANAAGRGRLESIKTAADKRFSDLNTLIGSETDVDIAQTSVDLAKTQTAYQAAMQAGAQVLKLSLLDYIR